MDQQRIAAIIEDIRDQLGSVIEKHQVTYDEYRQALEYLTDTVEAGELPVMADVFLGVAVDEVNNGGRKGTPNNIEGPYYVEGSPWFESPCQLAPDDEPGTRLTVTGAVRDLGGAPLAGAVLDFWQADAAGRYSMIDPDLPSFHLRGRLKTDGKGEYTLRTIVPAGYRIPDQGPTGNLLRAIGRETWRPAHLHCKASHKGHRLLTTQIYFEGDERNAHDAARAAKPSLVYPLDGGDEAKTLRWDVVLEAAA